MPTTLLKLEQIEKSFASVPALKPLSLDVATGEFLGLVGENGAGKSTLIRILSGVYQPDKGQIKWLDRQVRFPTPRAALEAGIATIHQELASFGHLTLAENLLMGEPWPRHRWGGVDWGRLHELARATLAEFEIRIAPETLFRELSPAQQQEVAIARALSRGARLLILDEPTASLSEPDAARLFSHLTRLRTSGTSIIYVSHRLPEILKWTDRIAVLRDGELVANYPTRSTNLNQLVRDMVGRPLDQVYPRTRGAERGAAVLEIDGATRRAQFQDITLQVRAGEIVGLAGLIGSGRSELARAIFGLYPLQSGQMRLAGKIWRPSNAFEALQNGLAYIPEERKRQGFVLDHSVRDSISIGFSDLLTRLGLIDSRQEHERVADVLQRYVIRVSDLSQPIRTLSGGNQQKALLGRWLSRDPRVIIFDEPTRGVDVGAKAEIHSLMDRLARQGKAVLLISSDLPEIMGMSDRILVMHEGRLAANLSGSAMTQENVILAASGLYSNL